MNSGGGRLIPCSSLSEAERLEAAELAADAMITLYHGIRQEAVPILAGEFLIAEGELGAALALTGSGIDGLIAAYPAAEFESRQRISAYHALRSLSPIAAGKLTARLRQISQEIPEGTLSGDYIARFAIRPELRGSGAADHLMSLFLADHPQISLHVRSDNARALTFYRRHGLVPTSESHQFVLMQRG